MHVTLIALNSPEGSPGSCTLSACKITHYSHPGVFQVQLEQLVLFILVQQSHKEQVLRGTARTFPTVAFSSVIA